LSIALPWELLLPYLFIVDAIIPASLSVAPGPDHGVLIRKIPLNELWPPEQIPEMITDHTPQWFASGTFAFSPSPDNRTLIHKTR
jgi:hypothetical protein